ncbi:TPA: hypothetical protein ACHG1E_004047 [Escherichia coli]|uniref:hypothetical protein n=1 Tax=Escherichia coli TaxID=562 RepID=UPI00201D8D89|nr:hypothetical protein [Escherichia coli]
MDSPETELAKSASFSSHLTCVNSQHNPFPVFAACTALSAVSGILSVTTRLCRFFATGTCSYDGTAASFPVPKGVFDATATSRTTTGTGEQARIRRQQYLQQYKMPNEVHENVVIENSIISRETTDDESDINTLYLDSFKSKNNCKSFETNSNLLDKNGKPVEIMVCDVQELHFFVPKN